MNNKYDYIITGTGCAGLSLAIHLIHSKKFAHKKILLIDKDEKQKNDRTWCFWEKEEGLFEPVVYRSYEKTWIHGNRNFSRLLDLSPYRYKLIRGIDFYEYSLDIIRQHSNFKIITGEIGSLNSEHGKTWVECNGVEYHADFIFNSILFEKPVLKNKEYWLLQHFKGWIIETSEPRFTAGEATLMDFRVPQKYGTSFIYIMPFSATRALIEYTLFTEELLGISQYDDALKAYLDKYVPGAYNILEEESGVIPMTNHRFPAVKGNIINIGTAGGQTKGSSGYTFRFIQKHAARLTESLAKKNNPFIAMPTGPARFRFYDSVLLRILKQQQYPGNKIFTTLFRKNDPRQVLRFLDNESSYGDDLKIISSLPTWPFLKAAMKHL